LKRKYLADAAQQIHVARARKNKRLCQNSSAQASLQSTALSGIADRAADALMLCLKLEHVTLDRVDGRGLCRARIAETQQEALPGHNVVVGREDCFGNVGPSSPCHLLTNKGRTRVVNRGSVYGDCVPHDEATCDHTQHQHVRSKVVQSKRRRRQIEVFVVRVIEVPF